MAKGPSGTPGGRRREPPRPYPADPASIADAVRRSKRARRRQQPPEIETLAAALIRVNSAASLLAIQAAELRASRLPQIPALPGTMGEFVASRRRQLESKGLQWTDDDHADATDEYTSLRRVANDWELAMRQVAELNEALDALGPAFDAAAGYLSPQVCHRAGWISDQRVIIERAFKETLYPELAYQPRNFNGELARPGIEATLVLAKWLYDAEFDEKPRGAAGQAGSRKRSTGVDTSKCEPPLKPTRPISIGAAAKAEWFGEGVGKKSIITGIENGYYRVEKRSAYKLIFDLEQVATDKRPDAQPPAAARQIGWSEADGNSPKSDRLTK